MKFWIKAGISLALLAVLVWKSNLNALIGVMAETDLKVYSAAFLLFLFQQVVVAYCWQLLLRAQNNRVPFVRTLEVHFVGSFFGTFLPSSITMDIVRAYRLSRHLRRGVDAASSMFVTRVVGFWVNFVLASIVAIPVGQGTSNPHLAWTLAAVTLGFVAAIWIALNRWSMQLVRRILQRLNLIKIADKMERIRGAILQFALAKQAIFKLLVLSLFFQIVGIVVIFLVGRAVGIELGIGYYFIYIPLITALAVLPISVLGIGIREGAFVFFFAQAGVPQAQALSLSLLLFSQSLLMALIGGVWYTFDKAKVQAEVRQVNREMVSQAD
jgi:uncharacterized protein (TIRG00374 family)